VIRASIGNPYAVFVGVLILVIFSLLAYFQIPVQLKPEIEPLVYTINTLYPGAGAVEVEDQITTKLEKELAALNDLREVTSSSAEGTSSISLIFNDTADKSRTLLDIIQAVERVPGMPTARRSLRSARAYSVALTLSCGSLSRERRALTRSST
jgi:HAE1 family hydrophobic/amphiphilic exporter-1